MTTNKLSNLVDSKKGDILCFDYNPDNGTAGKRLVRVNDVTYKYIDGLDIVKDAPRRFSKYNVVGDVKVLGRKNDEVKTRTQLLTELTPGWPKSLQTGEALEKVLPIHNPDISSAKYHVESDSIILTYKEKPKPATRLEVSASQSGYTLKFFNSSGGHVDFNFQAKDNSYTLTDSDGDNVENPTIQDFVIELNDLFLEDEND